MKQDVYTMKVIVVRGMIHLHHGATMTVDKTYDILNHQNLVSVLSRPTSLSCAHLIVAINRGDEVRC